MASHGRACLRHGGGTLFGTLSIPAPSGERDSLGGKRQGRPAGSHLRSQRVAKNRLSQGCLPCHAKLWGRRPKKREAFLFPFKFLFEGCQRDWLVPAGASEHSHSVGAHLCQGTCGPCCSGVGPFPAHSLPGREGCQTRPKKGLRCRQMSAGGGNEDTKLI